MSDASKIADSINEKLDTLNDPVVSEDPFAWSDSEKDRQTRTTTFKDISERLTSFVYVPKTGTVVKIFLFGTVLPLALLAVLYLTETPVDEDMRLWVWGGLGVIAIISGIVAAIIADDPNINSDLCLAAYTVPRGWSFSRVNTRNTWEAYCKKFSYFKRGDEDQEITTRIWGYLDTDKKRPFQLFRFYYETVYYVPVTRKVGNSTITTMEKRTTPHNRYGIFSKMSESKIRFRITEVGGAAGLDSRIKLEFGSLNKAVDIFCDKQDELTVRQFLSPAVQEIVMKMSNDLSGMHIDFYPGLVLVITTHDFLDKVGEIELDKNATRFAEAVKPAGDLIEGFRVALVEGLDKIKKYNDNY